MPDQVAASLDPLVVTSPVIRSGTTLLQRLLCSSPEALIYGELCGQDLDFLLQLYTVKTQIYTAKKPFYDEALRQVLEGSVNSWIPDLMPDINRYLAAMREGAFAGLASCRDHALTHGRRIWGFKYPAWPSHMIRMLRQLMPQSRVVCIHRPLLDCIRSAKAQQELQTEEQLRAFCQAWKTNLEFALQASADPAFLLLSYEDLVSNPAAELQRLAHFAGLGSLSSQVMECKINTLGGTYTPPAELTAAELKIAAEYCDG